MLNGKTALITGSSLGIGYAVAEKLASLGCNVVMNGIEPTAEIGPKADALANANGIKAVYEACDVGDGPALDAVMERALADFGGIDIVVNNAVTRVFGNVEDTDPADWENAIDVNLNSAFRTIHHAMPGMKRNGWGRIVNMSSIYGQIGAAGRASYVTSKTALIGLTRAVDDDLVGRTTRGFDHHAHPGDGDAVLVFHANLFPERQIARIGNDVVGELGEPGLAGSEHRGDRMLRRDLAFAARRNVRAVGALA